MLLVAVIAVLLVGFGGDVCAGSPLDGADSRIEKFRKADVVIQVVDADGRPVMGAKVRVEQTKHAFLFGCNIFPLLRYEAKQQTAYGRQFGALLNYATLPFYWGAYEPNPGEKQREDRMKLAQWCKDHGIATKGHPLVWHNVYPKWGPSDPDETRESQKARVSEIVYEFKGLVDIWDVVNEATVSAKVDNGIGHWAKRDGTAELVGESLEWARQANPEAFLLYNDFNLSPDFLKLLADLIAAKKPFDAVGIQSHMHRGEWTLEKAWETCENYSRFGKPIHFTELTVLSGEHGWDKPRPWPTTPEGEARQADYVERFYTLLFSHPAVEAITWWDFMDGGWQGAPAGLIRADLTPKPVYDRLMKLVKGKWWTRASLVADSQGRAFTRAFLGDYRVTVTTPSGRVTREFRLNPGRNNWTVKQDR